MGNVIMKYPNKLKELRKKKGLTAEELSKLSNVSVNTIRSIDSGKYDIRESKNQTLEALAKALHCKIRDLY